MNQTVTADPAAGLEGLNPIQQENELEGTDSWLIPDENAAFGVEIEGYASATSVNIGETINFHVNVNPAQLFTFAIYRMGWYGGLGARLLFTSNKITGSARTYAEANHTTGLIEYDWPVSASWTVPTDTVSGVFIAKLTTKSRKEAYITFVVRDDERASDVVFQNAVTTYQAYNFFPVQVSDNLDWRAGKCLYGGLSFGPVVPQTGPPFIKDRQARKVSFNRPYTLTNPSIYLSAGFFFNWEYQMVRWLEKEGYDVRYVTDVDTHISDAALAPGMCKLFLSVGHDEYWSWQMRENVEKARDRAEDPINLGFFGANISHWQVRFENSSSTSQPASAPNRTMVGYKQHYNDGSGYGDPLYFDSDATNNYLVSGYWRDVQSFGTSCPSSVPNCYKAPEDEMVGVMTDLAHVSGEGDFFFDEDCPAWVKNGVANPELGFDKLVGYEGDRIHGSYSSTRNLVKVGESEFVLRDENGNIIDTGTSHAVYYEMIASGARVFAAGTIQWSWGLDPWGSDAAYGPVMPNLPPTRYDARVEVTTRNIMSRLLNLI